MLPQDDFGFAFDGDQLRRRISRNPVLGQRSLPDDFEDEDIDVGRDSGKT
jgi:hypothetical protein